MAQNTPTPLGSDPAARPTFEFRLPDPSPPPAFDPPAAEFAAPRSEQLQQASAVPGGHDPHGAFGPLGAAPAPTAPVGAPAGVLGEVRGLPGQPPPQAPLAAAPGSGMTGAPLRRMTAPRPHAARRRPAAAASVLGAVGSFDWRRTFSLHRRLLAGDLRTLHETAETETDNAPTLVVMGLAALAAALGAWLWLIFSAEGLSAGYTAARVVGIGLCCSVAAFAAFTAATWWAMRRLFEVQVDPRRLARPLALAAGFGVWQLMLFVPGISFAVGLVGMMAWFLLSVAAARAASPELDERGSVISVGIGFGVYVTLLTLIADIAGVAPGIFVHAGY